jgi:hypothetical protein
MSRKPSDLSWLSSPQSAHVQLPIQKAWGTAPTNLPDAKFLRSWLVYDSSLDDDCDPGSANWNRILGLGIAIGTSAGLWVAAGVVATHFLK